jgi:[ribosomal protein S5]-alanine N-acetyltransferase
LFKLVLNNKLLKFRNMKFITKTERLIIREIDFLDEAGMFEMDADPEVHLYIENNPVKTIDQTRDIIKAIKNQYLENGIARWAVVDRDTNEFLGWCGLRFFKETINNHKDFYELGYRFKRKHWGKGYATESCRPIIEYGFANLGIETIYSITDINNTGSKNVLKKLGFKNTGVFEQDGKLFDWHALEITGWIKQNREKG